MTETYMDLAIVPVLREELGALLIEDWANVIQARRDTCPLDSIWEDVAKTILEAYAIDSVVCEQLQDDHDWDNRVL